MTSIELGLDTFGDVTSSADGVPLTHAQVLRNVVEEAVLADTLGIDFIGIGEHHRADFAVSAPEILLAAAAMRTTRIRLGSAVTVLSSDDPIRVFQRFSSINALSNGRAEVILGRGSFTESFPLFGFALRDYETLFEEKLEIFAALVSQKSVSWKGTIRPPLTNQQVFPPIETGSLRTWIGVGGSPESVVRAARHNLPLMLAIIGGDPKRFVPYVDLSKRAYDQLKLPMQAIGVHSPGYVADTDEQARAEFWPDYKRMRDQIGAERGWPPMEASEFRQEIDHGSLYVGSPETVARKIAATIKALDVGRFDLKYSAGPLPHEKLMRCIELYGTKVAPMVRDLLA
ncbi:MULTISPECIES: LLM class flavin-dependent oxidoreductase [unclassified Rhizobium]|uniref:LLM class flavin-dependent oxidoreductase n=1 Tax=unclassified Rhizobium TaxID=2613769 RepID=UPI001ADD3B39|nr:MULTISPECIES: LLM class flavin-dependent oxidoreductase [unclassified Rhizobium]MBO9097655.1 LLM class flavin-dependent oxidoreductase [Rhizobium sp. L58/93]MBO9133563.1 LLM class flavin-dependent oxidoreductase [Rhizobium sp. B209b/85]MBO9167804.1 LLM class flavin-dependent oxidoreductase [Rhizobium sp. L245/93]MBO9183849.1 LLM class flavin-dependent oxidoreductase [Rhizobium sp. E27B/91]QXZ84098.1 LLM class flavin-dependent oxidoreductase [Rhizobium sp. K1/93]